MRQYIALLRNNPQFARLWAAQGVSLLGDWFNTIALSTLVSRYTGGSGGAVSGLLLARFLPPLLVGPFAGVLVDRLNRKHLLILSDVLRAVVVLLMLLVSGPETLWLIYALTVAQFLLSSVFEPGRSALLPSVVKPDDLVIANTLGSVTWSVMLAFGAVVGGAVAGIFGSSVALIIDAVSFALSALLIASISVSGAPGAVQHSGQSRPGERRGFIEGLRYAWRHPATAAVLLVKMGGNIGNIDTLMVVYATQVFVVGQDGSVSLGIMWSAFGIGAILGPLLINRLHKGSVRAMRRLIILAYGILTLGWFALGSASTLALASLALLIRAMGGSVYWTYSSVIIQKSVPNEYLGRMFALDWAGFQLAVVINILVTGFVLERVGVAGVRGVAYGTGLLSLLPLVLWTLALPWIERQDSRTLTTEPLPAGDD